MICYRDTTFCASDVTEHTCGREFTEQDTINAEKWWGGKDYPVAYSEFCKEADTNQPDHIVDAHEMVVDTNQASETPLPELACAAIEYLESEISRLYWNKNQEQWESAFRNTGNSYKSSVFSVEAYDWSDEEDGTFKWRDIEISWYKNFGRGTYSNKVLTPDLINEMLEDCLKNVEAEL